jgi:hypothetical protein
MMRLVRRVADRMVALAVPRIEAQAQPCWWGNYCYCRSSYLYYERCCVQGSTYSCSCQARIGPTGCS